MPAMPPEQTHHHLAESALENLLERLPRIVAEGRDKAERSLRAAQEKRPGMRLRTQASIMPVTRAVAIDGLPRLRPKAIAPEEAAGRLIHGDNLPAMSVLLAGDEDTPSLCGRIDTIYADPPTGSQVDYRARVLLPSLGRHRPPAAIAPFAYSDVWPGMAAYLQATVARLVLMRELLAEAGSILVHLGGPASACVRLALDEIFGKGNFIRDVIWRREADADAPEECIAHYAKARDLWCSANAARSERVAVWCEDAATAAHPCIVWTDIPALTAGRASLNPAPAEPRGASRGAASVEATGYSGEKPQRLLERLIDYACPEGGLVADFYAGSGTAAVAAASMDRRWIAADASPLACAIAHKRLIAAKADPYLLQAIEPRLGTAHPPSALEFIADNLAGTLLEAYGAVPLPATEDPAGNLGAIEADGVRTLVRVDTPQRPTGDVSLHRALAQFEDGWHRVVVLGWCFDPSLNETLAGEDFEPALESRLEVLAIQPGALERTHREDGTGGLGRAGRFGSLRHLRVRPIRRERTSYRNTIGDGTDVEVIEVVLDRFVVLSPGATGLNARDRGKLVQAMAADSLVLIEHWAVDPDYDGRVFRSVWQDYRGRSNRPGFARRVAGNARFEVPFRNAARRVCVRAVDVFGIETEVVQSVPAPDVRLDEPSPRRVREARAPLADDWLENA